MAKAKIAFILGNASQTSHLGPVAAHLFQRTDIDVDIVRQRDVNVPDASMDDMQGRNDLQDEMRLVMRGAHMVITSPPELGETYGMVAAAVDAARVPVLMYRANPHAEAPMMATPSGSGYLTADKKDAETLTKAGFSAQVVGRPKYDVYGEKDIPALAGIFRNGLPIEAQGKKIIVLYGEQTPESETFLSGVCDVIGVTPDVFVVYRGARNNDLINLLDQKLPNRWAFDRHRLPYPAMAGGDQHIAYAHPILNDITMLNAWSKQPLGIPVSSGNYPWYNAAAGWPALNFGRLVEGLSLNFTELARRRAWMGAKPLVAERRSAASRVERIINQRLQKHAAL